MEKVQSSVKKHEVEMKEEEEEDRGNFKWFTREHMVLPLIV